MANSIAYFKKYITLLDEVYKNAAVTSVLDGDSALVQQGANANEIIIPKISMDGLADYSRGSGYVQGDVTLTNETVTFNYDRGRKFAVDAMDNEESAGIAFGKLSSEFIRTRVVPEMDAFRFASYAGLDGISKVARGKMLVTGEEVVAALRTATNTMDENEVPMDNRILFITPTLRGMIEDLETIWSREVMSRFSQVILVPQARFYTAINLLNGTTTGETAGGYERASGGAEINFMVIHKPALIQYTKHTVNKIITPDANQTSDGWLFFYRAYGLASAYDNKLTGIYLHHKDTSAPR